MSNIELVLALLITCLEPEPCKSEEITGVIRPVRFTAEDVHTAPTGLEYESMIRTIFRYEVGGVNYDPYALHTQRECHGPGGLCSFGLLNDFHKNGYTDRHNPYQVAEYINSVLRQGRFCNWPYLCNR